PGERQNGCHTRQTGDQLATASDLTLLSSPQPASRSRLFGFVVLRHAYPYLARWSKCSPSAIPSAKCRSRLRGHQAIAPTSTTKPRVLLMESPNSMMGS